MMINVDTDERYPDFILGGQHGIDMEIPGDLVIMFRAAQNAYDKAERRLKALYNAERARLAYERTCTKVPGCMRGRIHSGAHVK
jgi:hypothetical protein